MKKKKNYFATELVRAVDDLKKIFLMCEYFEKTEDFEKVVETFDLEALKKTADLETFVKGVIDFVNNKIAPLIDKETREGLERSDYEVYTDKYHHRKYWNEIPLPDIGVNIINAYKELAGLDYSENKKYVIEIYDLSEEDFYFASKKELKAFLEIEDVEPYTAFKIVKREEHFEYLELCSSYID